jgi:hypothetical protein
MTIDNQQRQALTHRLGAGCYALIFLFIGLRKNYLYNRAPATLQILEDRIRRASGSITSAMLQEV